MLKRVGFKSCFTPSIFLKSNDTVSVVNWRLASLQLFLLAREHRSKNIHEWWVDDGISIMSICMQCFNYRVIDNCLSWRKIRVLVPGNRISTTGGEIRALLFMITTNALKKSCQEIQCFGWVSCVRKNSWISVKNRLVINGRKVKIDQIERRRIVLPPTLT